MDNCIFCKIITGEMSSDVVYRDEDIMAFKDISPQAPIHIVIVPIQHFDNILNVPAGNETMLHVQNAVNRIAIKLNIATDGFRLVCNCGHDAGQTVEHLHFHLIAGRELGWPPG